MSNTVLPLGFVTALAVVLECVPPDAVPPLVLYPEFGRSLSFDALSARLHDAQLEVCDAYFDFAGGFSSSQRDSLERLCEPFEERRRYYAVEGIGCSWYCGGGIDTQSATSCLPSSGGISYEADNAHDLDLSTAWVEGVPGDGVGQALTYHFPPINPRITEIIVANGYIRTTDLYHENGRVRTLIVHYNGEPLARLELADTLAMQRFALPEPVGYKNRSDYEALATRPAWTLRFEIAAVYSGTDYEDTAISEIWFDGIDVH